MTPYDRISRYKSQLMGIAILIVVYGHYFYYHSGLQLYQYLNITMWYTIGSVDIFIFLSGFGIWRSLSRNGDPLRFMQRRLSRLLPSYLPFILLFCGFCFLTGTMNKWQVLGNLTTFGWWAQMGGQFNWYIPSLIVMYLLSPLFYRIIETYGRKSLWAIPLMWLISAGCVGTSLMIGVSRFPVYFLGLYLGRQAAEGRVPTRNQLRLSGVAALVSMLALYVFVQIIPNGLSRYGLWWHPYLFSTPGCLFFTSWCLQKHEKWAITRALNRFLRFLGENSFEIYLWHILVYTVALTLGLPNTGAKGWLLWGLMAVLGIALGCGYGKIVSRLLARRKSSPCR